MLRQRIQILLENNVIRAEVADFTNQMIAYLESQHPDISAEEATCFITHLAMATQRILNNEIVDGMDDSIYQEVVSSAGYDKAQKVLSYIEQHCTVVYPESEKQFLMLHLSNMFQERRNADA